MYEKNYSPLDSEKVKRVHTLHNSHLFQHVIEFETNKYPNSIHKQILSDFLVFSTIYFELKRQTERNIRLSISKFFPCFNLSIRLKWQLKSYRTKHFAHMELGNWLHCWKYHGTAQSAVHQSIIWFFYIEKYFFSLVYSK